MTKKLVCFFSPFLKVGCRCVHHVNQHRVVAMVFPRRLGVAVSPPLLEALLEGGHRQLKDLQLELEQLRLQLSAAPPVPAMPGRAPSTPAEAC